MTRDGPALEALTLRRFEPRDAEALSQLIIDNLQPVNRRDYGEAAMTQLARFYTPAWVAEYAQAGETVVALEGSALVGTATLQQARVRNVFVKVGRHGRGIGRSLMGDIEDVARRQGLRKLVLWANTAAVDFYLKLGYHALGLKEERVGEALLQTMVMEKAL